jgi:N-acetyl-1-D-myo-inositol-2-amino-2-deoxy-alpha-D-glucopyranoside deacetylase
MAKRSLVFVHAHPDDEVIFTGGTIARYADEGARVVLITCTNGEEGEIAEVPELGTVDEIKPQLGKIRIEELKESCRLLGDVELRTLGYHDSGMDGTPENEAAHAFVNQPLDVVTARIAEIFREIDADVLVTYNAIGQYGHPDHIQAQKAAMAAAEMCDVAKAYEIATPKSFIEGARVMAEQFGWDADQFYSEDDIGRLGTDDADVTTTLDVTAYVDRKFAALAAHRTQLGTTQGVLSIPEAIRPLALGNEHYVLVRGVGPETGKKETDLFEGLA